LAALVATMMERLEPAWVAHRDAAAVDSKAAANLETAHRSRHHTFANVTAAIPEDRLRHSRKDSTTTA
jgi:hypothetical protein